MAVFDETLYTAVPHVYRRVDDALQGPAAGGRAPVVRPFVRIGSWVGGDRDGNPFVTASVTRKAAKIASEHVLLPPRLTRWFEAVAPPVLLELPTGKVLARTTWHFRDHGQYLFPIAHGRFLLRTREKLVILAPLLHLAVGKPFAEEPFLEFKRKIGYVSVSPGGDLLMIETTRPARHKPVVLRKVGDADVPDIVQPAEPDPDEYGLW